MPQEHEPDEDDEPEFEDPNERPEDIGDDFMHVPVEDTGYAVGDGDLWVQRRDEEYGDEFRLRIASGRSITDMALIVNEAIRTSPDIPSAASSMVRGDWVAGDYSDLKALISALKHYENYEAPMGNDKAAYDLRTACNHATYEVRKRIAPDAPR